MNNTFFLRPHAATLLSVLRIVIGLVFLHYGLMKIFGFPVEAPYEVGSLPWIAGLFELILGFMLLIGFATRISAFILSGVMAFAYFLMHFPQSFFPAVNDGTAAVVLCFVLLYIAAAGPGPLSVDASREPETY